MAHRNPSLSLEEELKTSAAKFFFQTHKLPDPYYILPSPASCINVNLEHLRYIQYQPFQGRDSFGTIQECKSLSDADRHWTTQKKYDSRVLIHPQECFRHEKKYMLLFEKVVTDFKFWIEEHENSRVPHEDMWEILKRIGNNLIYLSSKNRPHGNLNGGIVITTDRRPLFLNLGPKTDAVVYKSDVKALKTILEKVGKKMPADSEIRKHVERWKSFLSKSGLDDEPIPPASRLSPPYCADHVKMVFNYPSAWDVEKKLQFLENIYKLCKNCNLMRDEEFKMSLRTHSDYSNWPAKVTSGVSTVLNEVYGGGQYATPKPGTNTRVIHEESIVIFANDCLRHHYQSTQRYNDVNTVKLAEVKPSDILDELFKLYPHLVEDIYEAFHKALEGGYARSAFTVDQIMTVSL